ncbi:hypothetical protein [Frateuria soli]|uniref:hypothetical protein n=1 Tax=Frateuria soli TaxID=1542730 RepID=UPI001E42FF77|nr:hypothetical protein [Frateuria soli]UGB37681.1 hypothetical protein LQ771_12730 [Frateuria soli]
MFPELACLAQHRTRIDGLVGMRARREQRRGGQQHGQGRRRAPGPAMMRARKSVAHVDLPLWRAIVAGIACGQCRCIRKARHTADRGSSPDLAGAREQRR